MIDNSTYELIDAYLNNTLTTAEKEVFEELLKSNPEVREELNIQKNLFYALDDEAPEHQERLHAEKIVKNASQNYHRKRSLQSRRWMAVAASIVILLGLGYFTLKGSSTQSLYDDYANWNELPSLTDRTQNTNDLATAETYFLNKDYNNAIIEFEDYTSKYGNNPQVLAYLGAAYLEIEDYDKAITAFDNLEQGGSLDSTKALWYKALVYLKADDKQNATKILEYILQNPNHYKYNTAKKLLEELQ